MNGYPSGPAGQNIEAMLHTEPHISKMEKSTTLSMLIMSTKGFQPGGVPLFKPIFSGGSRAHLGVIYFRNFFQIFLKHFSSRICDFNCNLKQSRHLEGRPHLEGEAPHIWRGNAPPGNEIYKKKM